MRWSVFLAILCLASCGYVGPVLPPSPEIPTTIGDLAAVERGDQIIVTFTTPPRTLDGVAVTGFSHIELRIQPTAKGLPAKSIDIDLPSPSAKEDPQPKPILQKIPVSDWTGQRIDLSARTAVKKAGHFSDWSNSVALNVISPLGKPTVQAEASPTGIALKWDSVPGVSYRVNRQGPSDKQPVEIAPSVAEGKYADNTAQYDTAYRYTITATKGSAESLPSETVTFTAKDTFAPAVPAEVTILAGPDAINIAWQRDSEPDLQGYYIYRSVNGGPFERQADIVTLPTYIDHALEHGKTYTYKITAIDKKNNESAPSVSVEAQY